MPCWRPLTTAIFAWSVALFTKAVRLDDRKNATWIVLG